MSHLYFVGVIQYNIATIGKNIRKLKEVKTIIQGKWVTI